MWSSSVRDRTKEFLKLQDLKRDSRNRSLSRSESASQDPDAAASKVLLKRSKAAAASLEKDASTRNFTRVAAEVNAGISATTRRLAQLHRLAQQRSNFNDPAQEIERLTFDIKADLQSLTVDIDKLEEYMISHLSGNKQTDVHTQNVISTLKSEVANTTKEFAQVLQLRSKNLKLQSDRRKQYSSGKSLSHRPRPQFTLGNSSEERTPLMQQSALAQGLESKDMSSEYLENRAEAVENIERTIQELGQMYQRLATIVSMQNEMAIRIDADMELALDNVNKGHSELLRLFENVSSNRWLILKVFATLILFAILFILFVA